MGGGMTYTTEQIIAAMKAAATHDGRLSILIYLASGHYPRPNAIIKRFGSWSKAVKAAGLMDTRRGYADEEMVEAMRAESSKLPGQDGALSSYRYIQSDRRPGMHAILKRFGSWSKALEAAGLRGPEPRRDWTEEEVLEGLRAEARDGRLTISEYAASGRRPTAMTIIKRFGTWNAAGKAAGLEAVLPGRQARPRRPQTTKAKKTELIEALRRLAGDLGHVPTYQDMELAGGVPDKHTYIAAFGSVKNALIAAGIEPGTTGDRLRARPKTTTRECLKCDDEFPSHGVGNRLCDRCRDANEKQLDPYTYGAFP